MLTDRPDFDTTLQAYRLSVRARSRNRATAGEDVLNSDWVWAAGQLHLAAERRLWDVVEVAHRSGLSWAQIGRALGVSGQAAHQRFTKPPRGQLV